MRCPQCGSDTMVAGVGCTRCGASASAVATGVITPVPEDWTVTRLGIEIWPEADTERPATASNHSPSPLAVGQIFAGRYHIIRKLGAGGMGCVYQAWDVELGIAVAVKVIRPEISGDPAAAATIERRFKRELLLARQVSHKNVVRIHDLGDVDGMKYITMTYVEGADLHSVLTREGRLPVSRVIAYARQIAAGLEAAHEVGVVHRDLKPANIMVADDHVQIMDFGIARSIAAPAGSGTLVGSVFGTVDYMAPEQAQGLPVDQRADIYAFGLILYDMLLGRRPAASGMSAVATLIERMKSAPPSMRSIDAAIPAALDAIVTKCLLPDPAARFQTTIELVAALARIDDAGLPVPEITPLRVPRLWLAAAAAIVVLLVGTTSWVMRARNTPVAAARPPLSVLIADFENRAGDSVFDGALEDALGLAMEGASFITSYPRATAQRTLAQLKPGARLQVEGARIVSNRDGINVVLAGVIERAGSEYRISVNVIDPVPGRTLAGVEATAASKAQVFEAVGTVAGQLRKALGDANPESATRAADETFTAASLEAARDFSVGQNLASAGKHEQAIVEYKKAIAGDPKFGRAYASWATSAAILGRREESAEAYKHALSLVDRMTEREKLRTLGTYYLTTARNYSKAVENYAELVRLYPADRTGHHNLALAHFYLLDFRRALDEGRRALEIYPKNETSRTNYALYAMYAGDFATAATEARRVVEQNPAVAKAYLPLAMGALAQGDFPAAEDAYARMTKTGAQGASLGSIGAADVALYQGRFADAARILEAGIAADEQARNTAGLAAKLLALAEVRAETGAMGAAVETATRALAIGPDEAIVVPAARMLLHAGRDAEASRLAATLGQQLQPQRQAYARILQGEIALSGRRYADAVNSFRAAQKLADVWLGRYELGIAYLQAGHHAEALAELELAYKRRGEATAIFLDDVPSFRYLVPLHYWLARAQETLGIPTAAANYRTFLALRPPPATNPLSTDAARRVKTSRN